MKKDAVRFTTRRLLYGAALIASAGYFGCTGPEPSSVKSSPAPPASASVKPAQAGVPEKPPALPPPEAREVKEALKTAYQDSVILAAPRFLVGDFDGDGSEDLAAIVRPASGGLAKLNSEYARWKLDDPMQVITPRLHQITNRAAAPPSIVHAAQGEPLLAIIHGAGLSGWRRPGVNNAFLLKHAVGEHLAAQSLSEMFRAAQASYALPGLHGDVLSQSLKGRAGFLYYTGGTYAWFALQGHQPAMAQASKVAGHLR